MIGAWRRKSAGLKQRNVLTRRVVQLQFVEVAVAEARVMRFETSGTQFMHVLRKLRPHEAEHARGAAALVQSEADSSVTEHAVGMRPGVAGGQLREAEPLIELHRGRDVGRGQAEFEETAEHAQSAVPSTRCASARA